MTALLQGRQQPPADHNLIDALCQKIDFVMMATINILKVGGEDSVSNQVNTKWLQPLTLILQAMMLPSSMAPTAISSVGFYL